MHLRVRLRATGGRRVNPLTVDALEDVQSQSDSRGVVIDEVGIADLRLPVRVAGPGGTEQATVASMAMNVALGAATKGTHMSRFVEVMAAHTEPIDLPALGHIARQLRER